MTQPKTRRTTAEYRWTRPKIVAFLRAVGEGHKVAPAARAVGMSRQSAYRLRDRLGPKFARIWDEAVRYGAARRVALGDRWRWQGDGSGAR